MQDVSEFTAVLTKHGLDGDHHGSPRRSYTPSSSLAHERLASSFNTLIDRAARAADSSPRKSAVAEDERRRAQVALNDTFHQVGR